MRYLHISLFAILLFTGVTGCSDFLNADPQAVLSEEEVKLLIDSQERIAKLEKKYNPDLIRLKNFEKDGLIILEDKDIRLLDYEAMRKISRRG